jgi:hypothetical protein
VSPWRWHERLLRLATVVVVAAGLLYLAARLILAALPVIVGVSAVVLIGWLAWRFYEIRRSRW